MSLDPDAPYQRPAYHPKPASLASRIVGWMVVIAVLLFLAAIIIPTSTHCRCTAPRSVDSSNLRQVAQASLIYASDHEGRFPQVDDIHAYARDLAIGGILNDSTIWITTKRRTDDSAFAKLSTVLAPDRQSLDPAFAATRPDFAVVVRGLHDKLPGTTPIAWTRGLRPDGTWSKDSPYGGEGGHIVFLGGNVAFYRNLGGGANGAGGQLVARDGTMTADIRAALPADAVIANN